MDLCGEAMSSMKDDLKEPSTLSQVSDGFFENRQVKMNNSISENEVNGCDLEQSDEIATNQMAAKK